MRYTILGFSQKKAIELNLDMNDLLILRWFVDFYHSGKMVKMSINDKEYVWVKYSKIIEDIPILKMQKTAISRRFKKICNGGIMEHKILKENGTFSLYRLTPLYEILISDISKIDDKTQKYEGSTQKYEGYDSKVRGGSTQKYDLNINLLKDKTIKDNNIYIVEQIIKHLNEITNSNYKSTTRTTRDKIIARLNEGFTFDDFIVVIDKKFWDWKGTEFEQYMRPETLFGTKFESYLNQPVKKKTTKDIKLDEDFYKDVQNAMSKMRGI